MLKLGKVLAQAALMEKKHTIWYPSYGGEMRGGATYCFVKISDSAIASPLIEQPDIAIIFSQPSLNRFKNQLKAKSLLILNADFVAKPTAYKGIEIVNLPLNILAKECGSLRVANSVALGVLTSLRPQLLRRQSIVCALQETFSTKQLDVNLRGFQRGIENAAG